MKTITIPIMRAAALALAWLAPLGQAEKLPVETFFKDPEFSRMRLSPDGKWLAAIAPREGKNNLLTIRLSDRKLFGCTAEDENEVYSFNWISNERMIFQMKDRNNFPNGGLYAVNRDGSKSKVLHPSFKTSREFGSRIFKVMDLFDPLTDEGADILVEVRKGGGGFREDRAFYGNIVRLNTLTLDLQATYDLTDNSRITVGALNVTDEDPPWSDGEPEGYSYGTAGHSPWGTVLYARATVRF